jgi:transposase
MSHDQSRITSTAAIHGHDGAITASLELSTSKWLVTVHAPGNEKLSRHVFDAGDVARLLGLFARLRARAEQRLGGAVEIITIQEAGLDGFWLHRLLESEGIRSHVVDAASIPVPRRSRRAKSDRIDGEVLWRTLAAWLRGDPRVCSMVHAPSPAQEDCRRLVRERDSLMRERIRESNRIRGLLAAQGIRGYDPLRRDRRAALARLTTGDGRPLGRSSRKSWCAPSTGSSSSGRRSPRSRPSVARCSEATRQTPSQPGCSSSRASAPTSPPRWRSRPSSAASTIDASSPPLPGLPERHGAAARSKKSKASRRPATDACARP